jgi:hypothetical protein
MFPRYSFVVSFLVKTPLRMDGGVWISVNEDGAYVDPERTHAGELDSDPKVRSVATCIRNLRQAFARHGLKVGRPLLAPEGPWILAHGFSRGKPCPNPFAPRGRAAILPRPAGAPFCLALKPTGVRDGGHAAIAFVRFANRGLRSPATPWPLGTCCLGWDACTADGLLA